MRPKSIVLFDRMFLASLVIGAINAVLTFNDMMDALATNPNTAPLGWGSGAVVAIIAVSLLIPLLLWHYIAHRASSLAKWILVVLTVGGILFAGVDLTRMGSLSEIAVLAVTVLQIAAIVMLFRPDANAWFAEQHGD